MGRLSIATWKNPTGKKSLRTIVNKEFWGAYKDYSINSQYRLPASGNTYIFKRCMFTDNLKEVLQKYYREALFIECQYIDEITGEMIEEFGCSNYDND